jgi:hypothetical protein
MHGHDDRSPRSRPPPRDTPCLPMTAAYVSQKAVGTHYTTSQRTMCPPAASAAPRATARAPPPCRSAPSPPPHSWTRARGRAPRPRTGPPRSAGPERTCDVTDRSQLRPGGSSRANGGGGLCGPRLVRASRALRSRARALPKQYHSASRLQKRTLTSSRSMRGPSSCSRTRDCRLATLPRPRSCARVRHGGTCT